MYASHMALGGLLHRLMPSTFDNPHILYMLMNPRLSYSSIYR
jgi:hypothetical protein